MTAHTISQPHRSKTRAAAQDATSLLANHESWFGHLARTTATLSGKPVVFMLAVGVVLLWAALGPVFHYSDTWQLVINTGTTIVTFLMVFLIQNTQNRDQMAMQIKLAELIVAMEGAKNRMALAEDLSDEELQELHEHYRSLCEDRRAGRSAKGARAGEAGS